jgi:hypothetical protein
MDKRSLGAGLRTLVFDRVSAKCASKRTVQESMLANRWISDIWGNLSAQALVQCLQLLVAVGYMVRDVSIPDHYHWPWSKSGKYTASSAYNAMCWGNIQMEGASEIWQSWAPLKCKIFAWPAVKFRHWTSERKWRHGLQDEVSACYTCLQEEDELSHILMGCVYARQVWWSCFHRLHIQVGIPSQTDALQSWWLRSRRGLPRKDRRGFDSFVILVCWRLWNQHNARLFQNVRQQFSTQGLSDHII